MEEATAPAPPPGWHRAPKDIDGVPLWKRHDWPCYFATSDMDQLRFVATALTVFDDLPAPQLHAFLTCRTTSP